MTSPTGHVIGMGESNCSWNRRNFLRRSTLTAAAAIYHGNLIIIQWNLSNQDTNGAKESVIVSEVSSFQRLKEWYTWGGKRRPV